MTVTLTRRQMLKQTAGTVLGAATLLGTCPIRGQARTRRERPNIILAMTDDRGWAHTGYNSGGRVVTPNLDAMAESGLRFDRFYATAPVCSPTRAACLTGRHPSRFGCFGPGGELPLSERSLAHQLRDAGYATGHFGKWHLGGLPRPGRPDRPRRARREIDPATATHPGNHGFDEWFSSWNFYDMDPADFVHNGEPVGPLRGEPWMITVDRAIDWIGRVGQGDQPFCAVIWFGNPHNPHQPAEQDLAHYRGTGRRSLYRAEVTGVDRAMGRLRAALRESDLADDTMLWFCSDNGPSERNAGGLRGGKGTLWENGVRVPGLLEWPRRITRGRRTDAVAGTLDIVPTLTDLLDIRLDSGRTIDGVSLLPVIAGTADSRSSPMPFDIREQRTAEQRHAALIDGRWKLHQYDNRTELYDLQEDPGEAHDVAGGQRAVTRRMTGQLTAWTRSVDAELSATL